MIALSVALSAAGCESLVFKGGPADIDGGRENETWPFAPVGLRIHPFTAIEYDAQLGYPVLSAQIELIDPMGDMTKGVGRFRIELLRVGTAASAGGGQEQRLYAWDVDLSTLEQNRLHYDALNRTYSLQLRMDQLPEAGTKLRLHALFTDRTGRRMSSDAELIAGDVASE